MVVVFFWRGGGGLGGERVGGRGTGPPTDALMALAVWECWLFGGWRGRGEGGLWGGGGGRNDRLGGSVGR